MCADLGMMQEVGCWCVTFFSLLGVLVAEAVKSTPCMRKVGRNRHFGACWESFVPGGPPSWVCWESFIPGGPPSRACGESFIPGGPPSRACWESFIPGGPPSRACWESFVPVGPVGGVCWESFIPGMVQRGRAGWIPVRHAPGGNSSTVVAYETWNSRVEDSCSVHRLRRASLCSMGVGSDGVLSPRPYHRALCVRPRERT